MTEQDYEKITKNALKNIEKILDEACISLGLGDSADVRDVIDSALRKAVERERKRILEGLPERMRDDRSFL